ncbi:MAG: choice-of-anchor L domain-containing protein [Bryobacteraceae bacterium]
MRRFLLLGASFALAALVQAAPIVPVVSTDATALANAILGGIPGTVDTAVLNGDGPEVGTFSGATGLLPFDSGVFLTTGGSVCIPGPNNTNDCTGDFGFFSELSIEFTPTASAISIQYVFGSEEYPPSSPSFPDLLTIVLNGVNIALIPVTNDTVTPVNVNSGTNASFFTDNSGGALDLQYNGLAGIAATLTANGLLNPGVTNTLVIRIEDATDGSLDSGVFLRAASVPRNPVPEPATYALLGAGLLAIAAFRRKRA